MKITSLDILYVSLAVGFLAVSFFVSFLLYKLIETMRTLRETLEDARGAVAEVASIKTTIKAGALGIMSDLLANLVTKLTTSKKTKD